MTKKEKLERVEMSRTILIQKKRIDELEDALAEALDKGAVESIGLWGLDLERLKKVLN